MLMTLWTMCTQIYLTHLHLIIDAADNDKLNIIVVLPILIIGVLRGEGKGELPPPKNWLWCSKLEVEDQQGVVNPRS